MTARVAPFPWFGGKARLAPHIVPLLPAHTVYCEPFGGAASVLFAKARSKLEVYNDVDLGVVSFFRVLRDRPDELQHLLALTPYSRAEYLDCRDTWSDGADDLERARRWFCMTFQAFGGGGKGGCLTGWATDVRGRKNGSRPRTFAWRVDRLHTFADRLRQVQIECDDWRAILDRYDQEEVCFYLDPPYLPSTRKSGTYAHELTEADHAEFVERLHTLRANVVLSGYDSPLYTQLDDTFERFEFTVALASAKTIDVARATRTEVVWVRSNSADRLFRTAGAA